MACLPAGPQCMPVLTEALVMAPATPPATAGGAAAAAFAPHQEPAAPSWLRGVLDDFTPSWVQLDRQLLPVVAAMACGHAIKLSLRASLLSPGQLAHAWGIAAIAACMAACVRLAPAAYRQHSAVVRLLLLLFAFASPVRFGSVHSMDPAIEAPSTVPVLGLALDAFFLWMATRFTFIFFVLAVTRPPLYLAIPAQLLAVARTSRCGYCASPVLRHPTMQRRAAALHAAFAFCLEAVTGHPFASLTARTTPEQRCEALFLFFHLLFSFLVPVVLLLWSSGASSGRRRPPPASATARLERHLQDGLGLLLQPAPAWGRLPPLAVRWAIMIVVFYALSCSLLMGNPA